MVLLVLQLVQVLLTGLPSVGLWEAGLSPRDRRTFSLYHLCKYPETHFRYRRTAENAQKYGPYYMAITVFVLCIVTMAKGLKHVGLNLSNNETLVISLLISVVGMIFCHFTSAAKHLLQKQEKDHSDRLKRF